MTEQRQAGRGVVVAASGRVLLLLGSDPADPERGAFWFTPGGGLEPGEGLVEATQRELREEVGLAVDRLGPVLMHRTDRFRLGGVDYHQRETLFLVSVEEEFEPEAHGLDHLEASVIHRADWRTPAEMRADVRPVYPQRLADLVDMVVRGEVPDPPWEELIPEE